jgi:hypothetical protein
VLDAPRAFHRDLRTIVSEPPAFLTRRTHLWAKADQVAWSKDVMHRESVVVGLDGVFRRLMELRRPVLGSKGMSRLIHVDFTGNVLLASDDTDSAPGIINFSLYWRPVEYAEAMLVADGLLDFNEGEELIGLVGNDVQMLVRALMFRVVAWSEQCKAVGRPIDAEYQKSFERAVELVSSLIGTHEGSSTT